VHRVVLAMTDDEREKKTGSRYPTPRLPPRVRTEYERLCEDFGGPADIGVEIGHENVGLGPYCTEYPSSRVLPVLLQFQPDDLLARKHWPWAAFVISHYHYDTNEWAKYSDEPSPKEIGDLWSTIYRSGRDLHSALCRLRVLSDRQGDPSALSRRGHLRWLDAVISQAAAGLSLDDVSEQHLLFVDSERAAFLERLARIAGTAKNTSLDRTLLERERGQSNPALLNFVFRCTAIWRSLTGRKPSANKVSRGDREDPDFVIFLQQLARLQSLHEPTRKQVARCLRNPAPPTTDQKSL
jgi:hypothetical protein